MEAANFFISKKTLYSIINVFDICFWSSRQFDGDFESYQNESEAPSPGDPEFTREIDSNS